MRITLCFICILILSLISYAPSLKATEFTVQYDLDLLKNTHGGISTEFEYIDLLTLTVADKISMSEHISVNYFVSGLYSNGHDFSADIVGDDHIISNLEGGARFTKLGEAWANVAYKDYSLLVGLYDINGEFDVLESANLFLNSGHGIGNDIGLSGRNGPSIYPFYGLSLRVKWHINANNSFMFAISDGLPGDPNSPSSPAIELNGDEGSFSIAQWQYELKDQRWLFGAWQYSKSQAIGSQSMGNQEGSGNWGAYIRHERTLFDDSISGFFRFGISDTEFNKYDRFFSAGLVFREVLNARPDDIFGVALAHNDLSSRFAQSNYNEQQSFANGELNIELTYQTKLQQYVYIQPNVQYISHPAGIGQDSALVIGVRLSVQYH